MRMLIILAGFLTSNAGFTDEIVVVDNFLQDTNETQLELRAESIDAAPLLNLAIITRPYLLAVNDVPFLGQLKFNFGIADATEACELFGYKKGIKRVRIDGKFEGEYYIYYQDLKWHLGVIKSEYYDQLHCKIQ